MGWLTLALLIGAAMAGAVALGVRRPLWSLIAAALTLGAVGYALQGRPGLPASDARPDRTVEGDDPGLINLRERMLGHLSQEAAYMIAADAMQRAGEKKAAVQAVIGGLRRYPDSLLLWVGLGTVMAAHDGDRVSPPALFAFQQALRIAPEHPGPPFFLGLAYVRAGDFAAARPWWARAVRLSPEGASYRRDIAERLALLDVFLKQANATTSAR